MTTIISKNGAGDRLTQLRREAGLSSAAVLTVPGRLPLNKCFFKAMTRAAVHGHASLSSVEKAAMAEAVGSTGGYTVPPEYSSILFRTIAENSIFWPRAIVAPMSSVELSLPVPDFTTARSAGTTAMFGGLLYKFNQGATGNEGVALDETEPAFRQVILHAWDLIGEAVASIQYVEDLLALEDGEEKLLQLFGQAAAYYADWNFFQGTGANRQTPLGIINAPCKLAVTRAGANHIAAADVAGMAKKLLPRSWETAIWCVSPTGLVDLFQVTAFQPNENPAAAPPGFCGYLYTRPVFVTEKLPALGTSGDIVLFDPAMYIIGDRQQPEVAASRDEPSTFQYNQMMFRTWMRVDGKPLIPSAVTLADGSSTASCVVLLTT